MALKSARGNHKFAPTQYITCPDQARQHKLEVEALKKEIEEAKRKGAVRSAMRAPRMEERPVSESEALWDTERKNLIDDLNRLHREVSELRKFQKPVQYVDKFVEKVIEKPIEVIVEKFIEKEVMNYRLVAGACILAGSLGAWAGKVFL